MKKLKLSTVESAFEWAQIGLIILFVCILPWYLSVLAIALGITCGFVLSLFIEDEESDGTM
ncbi:hypothetical protein D3C75_447120 [compost metagenome]